MAFNSIGEKPGNTIDWSFFSISGFDLQTMRPPRGPRSVLCVVEVTTSACGTGFGYAPAATRPATCAMSTKKYAPTDFAIAAKRPQSITCEYAEKPATTIFGECSRARRSTSS